MDTINLTLSQIWNKLLKYITECYKMLHLRHRQPWLLRNGIGLSMNAVEQEIAKAFCVFLNTIQFGKTTLGGKSFIINDVLLKFNNVFTLNADIFH